MQCLFGNRRTVAALLAAFLPLGAANAATVPFVETFDTDSANWFVDSAGTNPVGWTPSLPGGGGFATVSYNFVDFQGPFPPAIFRAQDAFDSSGDAFVGDWISDGVTEFRAMVRHDADVPLNFFARFAAPANFPAAAAFGPLSVPGGVWTEMVFPIDPSTFQFEGPSTFQSVFGNLGNIQLGIDGTPLAGVDRAVLVSIDNVSIVPEPTTVILLVGGMLVACSRGRRPYGLRK